MSVQKIVFAAALLLMPFSYGVKKLLGLFDITWIDPTLILAALLFVLTGLSIRDRLGMSLVLYAFASATIGALYIAPALDRGSPDAYVIYQEPIRFALNMWWFWASLHFLKSHRAFALRWLSISVCIQFAIAAYLYLALFDWVPTGEAASLYLTLFKARQLLWFGDVPIYRMAGTFDESPPFGLFMFCSLVVLVLGLGENQPLLSKATRRMVGAGAVAALAGTIGSLADQVLIALALFAIGRSALYKGAVGRLKLALWASLACAATVYAAHNLIAKSQVESFGAGVYGQSIAERSFHSTFALGILMDNPIAISTGIGPGRYGDYVARTGVFPSSVGIQFAAVEWLVEYGIIGILVTLAWLAGIAIKARRRFARLGVIAVFAITLADMFQANWKWEACFFALAFLASEEASLNG